MTDASPLVTVVMACYNHERFVGQAIDSVWTQTHRPLELIVIDDASSDSTCSIVEEMAARSPIPMRVEVQSNGGPAQAFGHGVDLATGEWLAILASDDFYAPDFIERSLAEALRLPGNDWVLHSNAHLVEASGRLTGTLDTIATAEPLRGEAFELLVTGGGRLLPCTMFVRRDLFLAAGGFDPTMIAEDCDLQLRLARHARFHYIADPIFYSRNSPRSLGKRPWLWGNDIIRAIAKHEDVLGARLPGLLAQASANISAACFEHGRPRDGLYWAGQAISYAPGASAATTARIAARTVRATLRLIAYRLVGRDRLVALKRRLTAK